MPSFGVTGNTLKDVSGNGNDGTLTNMDAATDWVASRNGNSLEFDGSDDRIAVGDLPTLDNMSVQLTVRVNSNPGGYRGFIGAVGATGTDYGSGFNLDMSSASSTSFDTLIAEGGIRRVHNGTNLMVSSVPFGVWCNLCFVVSSSELTLFLNGVKESSATRLNNSTSTIGMRNLVIGKRPYSGLNTHSNIDIASVLIHSRALSPTEIKQLYVDSLSPFRLKKRTVVRVPATVPTATKVGSFRKPVTIAKPSYQAGYARNASESENPNLWDGLVGAWMPSFGVTGETLRDVSGNGNHGTLTNMDAATDWVGTSKGLALDFDGTNEMVDVDSPPVIDGSSATYSLWVKANSVYSWMSPCGYVTSGFDDYRFIFRRTNTGLIQTYVRRSNSINFSAATPSGFNWYDWNHFLIVANGSLSQTYVNGSFLASNNSGSGNLNFGTTFTLGNQDLRSGGSTWNGGISNVKLYNRALSSTEIKQLYVDSLAPFRKKQRVSVAVPADTPTPSATYHPLRSLAHPLEQ